MIWILYFVMMTPEGVEHWDPGMAHFESLDACESARNEIVENIVFKMPNAHLRNVVCLDEVVGNE